jgi:hypothetical protein
MYLLTSQHFLPFLSLLFPPSLSPSHVIFILVKFHRKVEDKHEWLWRYAVVGNLVDIYQFRRKRYFPTTDMLLLLDIKSQKYIKWPLYSDCHENLKFCVLQSRASDVCCMKMIS